MPGGTFYSNCSTITTGCVIYNDIYKTSPAQNGYYSDGTNCYYVGVNNSGAGQVLSVSTCSLTVNVYARYYYTPYSFSDGVVYYGVNSTSCPNSTTIIDITCDLHFSFSVSYNDVVTIGVTNSGFSPVEFSYAITPATTCPNPVPDWCGCNGNGASAGYASETITANTDIYITYINDVSGYPSLC